MKLVFIAGPCRASSKEQLAANIQEAERMANLLWLEGYAVICPHANSKNFVDLSRGLMHRSGVFHTPKERIFLDGYLEIMKRCDAVVALPMWRDSNGAVDEVNQALLEQIPVYDLSAIHWQEIVDDMDGSNTGPQRDMATMLTGDSYSTADMDEIEMRR